MVPGGVVAGAGFVVENGGVMDLGRWRDALLRQDLASFIAKSFATVDPGVRYLSNWHVGLIAEYLTACGRGEITRLIVNMPPRMLKSVCVSVAWPAWLLGHDPSRRIIACSYAQGLANKHATDCRLVLGSEWYRTLFPGTVVARGENQKHRLRTTARGMRLATSVGGTLTGEGGSILIADDPLNPRQAMSPGMRQRANEWFQNSFISRLDDKQRGAVVVVMQRLHEDDVTGFLLRSQRRVDEGGLWHQLVLPAVCERKIWLEFGRFGRWREEGELLHPARENEAAIVRAREEFGSQVFSAQYQQAPIPAEGGMLKREWFGRYDGAVTVGRIFQSWDTGIKAGVGHDYSVCTVWVANEERLYLRHVWRGKLEFPALLRKVIDLAGEWGADALLIEDKGSGQSLIQALREGTRLPVIAVQAHLDKVTRMAAVSPMIEAGRVVLPREALWLGEFERECLGFPRGAHDDQVDSMSQMLAWWKAQQGMGPRVREV